MLSETYCGLSEEVPNSQPQKLFEILVLVVPASEAKGTKIKGPLCYEIQNNCLPDTVGAGFVFFCGLKIFELRLGV